MLEGVSAIKDKVYRAKYQSSEKSKFDVEAVIAELRKNPKFKNFSDGELYDYAYTIKDLHNAQVVCGDMNKLAFDTGKPQDPFWSQFTYEEILNMVNDGISVPQEFIDWAYTKQDADTVSYQIETSDEDPNAYENLDSETGNIDQSDIQKRAQAFASKAKAQEELIHNRTEEVKPVVNKVQAEKNELERNQKMSLQKIESMTGEWKALDLKFKKGSELSEAEQKRYQELGVLLNDNNGTLVQQAQKVSGDIDELMNQIENIDMLLNINEKINAEIENVGTKMSWFEGNKQHIILPTHSGNQTTGLNSMIYSAAMGNNLAIDTGLTGINLFFNNLEVSREIDINTTLADDTRAEVNVAYDAADSKDENLKRTTNKQSENKGNDEKTEENKFGAQVQNPQNTEEQADPALAGGKSKAEVMDETIKPAPLNNTAVKSETNNVTGAKPETSVPSNSAEIAAPETSASPETSEVSETTDVSAATETTETAEETEDPLKAATQQYVNECQNRSSSMAQAVEQVQTKAKEIQILKMAQKLEEAKLNKELKKNLSEYESFAKKVQSGQQLTDIELKRVEAIEKVINSQNGTLIESMKNKVNTLSGFAADLQSGIQLTADNTSYGEETVAKGKEYARTVYGDREYLRDSMFGFIHFSQLSKEKQYDMLYGKSGESLGRDAIDNGELLIANSAKSNAALSKTLPLGAFAEQYAQDLTAKMGSTKQKVNAIKDSMKGATGADKTSDAKTSETKSKDKDKANESDAQNIKKQGNKVKEEGKEAKKDGEDAKRDKQSTDKQIKQETAVLKANAQRIRRYTQDSQEINKTFEEMSIQMNDIKESQSQQAQPQALSLNANANVGNNNGANDSTVKLQAIAARAPELEKRLKINDKNVRVMTQTSQRHTKKLTTLYNQKYKTAQADIKAKEKKVEKNEKLQDTITKTGYTFTGVKMTGMALMAIPWTHAVGAYMYGIGKYGEITCYVANAAVDVANGNFLGALVNVGAAALSYFTGPKTIGPASSSVQEAGKEAGKEISKDVGAEVTKQSAEQAVQQAAGGTLSAMAGSGTELAMQGAGEMIKESTKTVSQQLAKEGAKAALKQTVKEVAIQAVSAAVVPTLISATHKKDEQNEKQTRQRRLISFQEKRAREAKVDKIEKSSRAYMSRGKNKR